MSDLLSDHYIYHSKIERNIDSFIRGDLKFNLSCWTTTGDNYIFTHYTTCEQLHNNPRKCRKQMLNKLLNTGQYYIYSYDIMIFICLTDDLEQYLIKKQSRDINATSGYYFYHAIVNNSLRLLTYMIDVEKRKLREKRLVTCANIDAIELYFAKSMTNLYFRTTDRIKNYFKRKSRNDILAFLEEYDESNAGGAEELVDFD